MRPSWGIRPHPVRLHVDIGRAVADGLLDDGVGDPDDGGLIRDLRRLGRLLVHRRRAAGAVLLDRFGERAAHHTAVAFAACRRRRDRAGRAAAVARAGVILPERLLDMVLQRKNGLDLQPAGGAEVIQRDHVRRVGRRDREHPVVLGDGDHLVANGELRRHDVHGALVHVEAHQVGDEAQAHRRGFRLQHVPFRGHFQIHQYLGKVAARRALMLPRLLQLLRREHPLLDQQLPHVSFCHHHSEIPPDAPGASVFASLLRALTYR